MLPMYCSFEFYCFTYFYVKNNILLFHKLNYTSWFNMTRNIQLFNRNRFFWLVISPYLLIIESYMIYEVPGNLICLKCSSLHVLCECWNILGVFKCYGYSSRYTNKGKYISVCVVNVSQVFRHNRAFFIRHRVLISIFPFLDDIYQ